MTADENTSVEPPREVALDIPGDIPQNNKNYSIDPQEELIGTKKLDSAASSMSSMFEGQKIEGDESEHLSDASPPSSTYKPPRFPTATVSGICAVGIGACFGWALQKGTVYEPEVIIGQMNLTDMTMVKMFLMAVIFSTLSLSLLSLLKPTRPYFEHARRDGLCCKKGLPSTALGATILGVGMAIAGACPGTVYAQLGAGVPSSLLVLAGGLSAAAVFGLIQPYYKRFHTFLALPPQHSTLDTVIPLPSGYSIPFVLPSLLLAAMLLLISVAVELLFPWDMSQIGTSTPLSTFPGYWSAWPPQVAGVIIGLLQIPTVLLCGDTIGSSQSFMSLVSNALWLVIPKRVETWAPLRGFNAFRSGMAVLWQCLYVGGAILGALTAALLGATWNSARSVYPWWAFIGGFCIVMGARMAGGCTSGHGLSGMGLLRIDGMVAACCMFGGGIFVGVIMRFLQIPMFVGDPLIRNYL